MEFNSISSVKKKKIYHTSHNNSFFFIYPNMKKRKRKETQLTPFFQRLDTLRTTLSMLSTTSEKSKLKYLTFLFEVQSSIEEG